MKPVTSLATSGISYAVLSVATQKTLTINVSTVGTSSHIPHYFLVRSTI